MNERFYKNELNQFINCKDCKNPINEAKTD